MEPSAEAKPTGTAMWSTRQLPFYCPRSTPLSSGLVECGGSSLRNSPGALPLCAICRKLAGIRPPGRFVSTALDQLTRFLREAVARFR